MKSLKYLLFTAFATVVLGAFADAANMLLAFSTPGPDKYADGSPVLDGEWYALVWSADGHFEGFTPECTAVDPNDRVVIVASLAKDGRCPFTIFQVDSKSPNYKTTGSYAVYLLDTRNAERNAVSPAKDGKPASVNAVQANERYSAASAMAGSEATGTGAGDWDESQVDGRPRITAFAVNGAKVTITVDGLIPSVKYNIKMGPSVDNFNSYALEVPKEGVESATFKDLDVGDAKFFTIVREPLVKEAK